MRIHKPSRRSIRYALVLAFLIAVWFALGIFVWGWWQEPTREASAKPKMYVIARLTPQSHGLGDLVSAELTVGVKGNAVDVDRISFGAFDFTPYEVISEEIMREQRTSTVEVLRYRALLQCLDAACLLAEEASPLNFPNATLTYADPSSGEETTVEVPWQTATVVPRVTAQDLETPVFRDDLEQFPEISYRMSPMLLRWGFLIFAVALLLVAVRLLSTGSPTAAGFDETQRPAVPQLQWARERLLRAADAQDLRERSLALHAFALAVRQSRLERREELAAQAVNAAWSSPDIDPAAMRALADRVPSGEEETP